MSRLNFEYERSSTLTTEFTDDKAVNLGYEPESTLTSKFYAGKSPDLRYDPKPMRMSESAVNRLNFEHEQAAYEADKQRRDLAEASAIKEQQEYQNALYAATSRNSATRRVKFMESVKNAFMTECLMKIYSDSSVTPLSESDKIVAKNLINKFVLENGTTSLITRFSTKNLLLSEVSRICDKYITKVRESCDEYSTGEAREFSIDDEIRDGFFGELENIDTEDASKLIKDRVSDAMSEFIDNNMANKLEYEDVIKTAQDKMSAVQDETVAEAYSMRARRQINEMKSSRSKNVFHCVVEGITKAAFTDNDLKAKYLHEGSVDMDTVVNSAQLIYTMLEMVNTTNMATINEEFIYNYIESLGVC